MEPVSIFTTVIGILNIFRNNLKTFYSDAQDFAKYSSFNDTLHKKLKGLENKVTIGKFNFSNCFGEKDRAVLNDLETVNVLVGNLSASCRAAISRTEAPCQISQQN
jgi:hypothetical protein